MTRHSPIQQLKEAKQIALDHGCLVSERPGTKGTEYHVYRRLATRVAYLGKRSSPAALRLFVCQVTDFH